MFVAFATQRECVGAVGALRAPLLTASKEWLVVCPTGGTSSQREGLCQLTANRSLPPLHETDAWGVVAERNRVWQEHCFPYPALTPPLRSPSYIRTRKVWPPVEGSGH